MSSSRMDEINEVRANNALAAYLGITSAELLDLDFGDIETNESNDGLVYNGYIEIQKGTSDKYVLEKVVNNRGGDDNGDYITVDIDSSYFNEGPEYDDGPEPDDENPNPHVKHDDEWEDM